MTISKKIGKSVEFVLTDRFGVKKDEVGKSLSMYFGCPFRDFDEEFPIPFELIGKLKKSFLLYYVWVPLSWSKKGVEILVDDPKDLRKTDHIKALLPNQKIIFSVAFKEDVEEYIAHFFSPRAESTVVAEYDDLDDIIPNNPAMMVRACGHSIWVNTAALDRAGELDGTAEQQQLFGQRGLARVGVGNNGESAAACRFVGEGAHTTGGMT